MPPVQSADVDTASRPRAAPRSDRRRGGPVLAWWAGLLLAATALYWILDGREQALAPPSGSHSLGYAVLPPLVAAGVLIAVHGGLLRGLRWPILLALGFAASAAWTLGLAAASGALWTSAGDQPSTPPVPRAVFDRIATSGLTEAWTTAAVCLVGTAAVPLAAVAVRSLCGEPAARELLPVLALAPFAVLGTEAEALAWALGAAALAAAAVGSEPGRRGPLRLGVAVLCGLLLGTAALCGFAALLLGAGVICVFFVRRRPLLNVAAAAGFLGPVMVASAAGWDLTADLAATLRAGGDTGPLLGIVSAAVLLLVLGGPALIASIRSVRTTPGWPFLVAGAVGALGCVVAGLVAHRVFAVAWLPVLPWLTVGAVAPARQGGPSRRAGPAVLAAGAAVAYAAALLT